MPGGGRGRGHGVADDFGADAVPGDDSDPVGWHCSAWAGIGYGGRPVNRHSPGGRSGRATPPAVSVRAGRPRPGYRVRVYQPGRVAAAGSAGRVGGGRPSLHRPTRLLIALVTLAGPAAGGCKFLAAGRDESPKSSTPPKTGDPAVGWPHPRDRRADKGPRRRHRPRPHPDHPRRPRAQTRLVRPAATNVLRPGPAAVSELARHHPPRRSPGSTPSRTSISTAGRPTRSRSPPTRPASAPARRRSSRPGSARNSSRR